MDCKHLTGKSVVITGAGLGLGAAFTRLAAKYSASVLVTGIDKPQAEAVSESIGLGCGNAVASGHSVSEMKEAADLIRFGVEPFGRLDGLINNAALHHVSSIWGDEPAKVRRLVETNLMGAIYCTLAAARVIKAAGLGSITNLTSVAGLGLADRGAYGATKAALLSLTYSWALELHE